jgi:hypothetical protein
MIKNPTVIKKAFLIILLCGSVFIGQAQTYKQQLVNRVSANNQWMYGYIIKKTVNINLSEQIWKMVLNKSRQHAGDSTFTNLSIAFSDMASSVYGIQTMKATCGFTRLQMKKSELRQEQKVAVDAWGNRFSFTINADKADSSYIGYQMLMKYVNTIAVFLSDDNWEMRKGLVPYANHLHIVLNADKKNDSMTVKWNENYSSITISVPYDKEVSDVENKIFNGLLRGWGYMEKINRTIYHHKPGN